MLNHRVIPVLLLSDGGLVKTKGFVSPRYIGDPINAVKIFNEKEVDELVVLDIGASRLGREPDFKLVEELASEAFIPLTYGGGVTSSAHVQRLLSLGVEKVAVQTAATTAPDFVSELAAEFGSSTVVASLDLTRSRLGRVRAYSAARQKALDGDWRDRLLALQQAGAGEVLLQVVERDGTMAGMDVALIREASSLLTVPLVAAGGVGSLEDIRAAVEAGASAVAAGAFFVFRGPHRAVLISYPQYATLRSLLDDLR